MKLLLHIIVIAQFFAPKWCFTQNQDLQDYTAIYVINNAPYVLEGEVLASRSYRQVGTNSIMTSNLIRIHNIFRGDDLPENGLRCGTIEVTTRGGYIEDEKTFTGVSAGPSGLMKVGAKGLIFLWPTEDIGINKTTDNDFIKTVAQYWLCINLNF